MAERRAGTPAARLIASRMLRSKGDHAVFAKFNGIWCNLNPWTSTSASMPTPSISPSDVIHYREYKILLQPDRFTSKNGFLEFWEQPPRRSRNSASKWTSMIMRSTARCGKCSFTTRRSSTFTIIISFCASALFMIRDGLAPGHELTFKYRAPELQERGGSGRASAIGGARRDQVQRGIVARTRSPRRDAQRVLPWLRADLAEHRTGSRHRRHYARLSDAEEDRHQAQNQNGAGQ